MDNIELAWGLDGQAWQSEKLLAEGVAITSIDGSVPPRPRLGSDDRQRNAVRTGLENRVSHRRLTLSWSILSPDSAIAQW